jgi:hypothetical protein
MCIYCRIYLQYSLIQLNKFVFRNYFYYFSLIFARFLSDFFLKIWSYDMYHYACYPALLYPLSITVLVYHSSASVTRFLFISFVALTFSYHMLLYTSTISLFCIYLLICISFSVMLDWLVSIALEPCLLPCWEIQLWRTTYSDISVRFIYKQQMPIKSK